MSITPIQLISPQQITDAAATYYSSVNIKTRIDKMSFTNTDSMAHTVTLYLIPSGGTAGDGNTITSAHGVAAGETWNCPDAVGQILALGGFIQAKADTASVITISAAGATIS